MAVPAVSKKGKKVKNVAFKGYEDGTCEFLGDEIEAMLGYRRQDFNSKALKWTDLILKEDLANVKAAFVQALKSDKTYMREYRVRAKNGGILWIREWGQIVCDEEGKMEMTTGIAMDINEEKQQEILQLSRERKTGKYLTFSVADEEYGISILKVKEIIEVMPITPVPQAPPYLKGVINLRGKIIPVADLRTKLGVGESAYTERTCIIVLEVTRKRSNFLTGMVVDSVSEVLHIQGANIEDVREFTLQNNSRYLLGMAKLDSGLKLILDVDEMLGDIDIEEAQEVFEAAV